MADWTDSLTHSVRFENIMKLISVYETSDSFDTPEDARADARKAEMEVLQIAKSLEGYQQGCDQKISEMQARAPAPKPEEEEPEESEDEPSITIQDYTKAIFYRSGLFSTIYRARAPERLKGPEGQIFKTVALKLTSPSSESPPHDSKREARLLTKGKCDQVIPLLETFRFDDNKFVLVSPFMRHDLAELLRKTKPQPTQVYGYLRDLFNGLSHLHSIGMIHRDVKPSNILLSSPEGPAYLADFGIAWHEQDASSEPADQKITDVGTTCYRPPEILFGNRRYNESLDMWAAGCVAAELFEWSDKTLFDSGELGSDLALIQSIFTSLGTPNLTTWPEAKDLPDWGKMQFREYPPKKWSELLPASLEAERNLVSRLVVYESKNRATASEILDEPLFRG